MAWSQDEYDTFYMHNFKIIIVTCVYNGAGELFSSYELCGCHNPWQGFDLRLYVSKPWYIHAQMATAAGNPDNK
jgi:hypothetical protein